MISVIVPVYKAEKYLHRCIDSILAQTYTDFELLLIDDGSPDNCGAICDEYAEKDARVRVFHKINGGVSSARNLGLDKVKGEWVTFVDSDDYVHPNFFKSLDEKCNVDLVVESFQIVGSNEKWDGILEDVVYDNDLLKEKIVELSLKSNFQVPWGKFYRRDIIYAHQIKFDEKIHSGEDTLFVLNYLVHTRTLQLHKEPYYFYERGNIEGLSSQYYNIEHHFYAMSAFAEILKDLKLVFGNRIKYVYFAYIRMYCSKLICFLYHNKEGIAMHLSSIELMCKNIHLISLFRNQEIQYGRKVNLFHFLMKHKLYLTSLFYIYILKGKVYS